MQLFPLKSLVFVVHFLNAFWHGKETFPKSNSYNESAPLLIVFYLPYSKYKGMKICFYSCCYQNQNFSLVSHSCRLCRTRVALMSLVQHLCRTCVALVSLVSHSCRSSVASVALVLHSCYSCRTRVARVWHSCCKLDQIKSSHSTNILKQLPISIETTLCNLSSNPGIFNEASKHYEKVLYQSGYDQKLQCKPPNS